MIQINDRKNRTVLGYHNRLNSEYTLIEGDPPIITNEEYSPFLLTKDHLFSISTRDIVTLVNNYRALTKFNKFKNQIAQLLILPGLIVSLLYIINNFELLTAVDWLEAVVSSKVTGMAFWISVLGTIILWHDYYRTKSHPVKLPKTRKMDEKMLMSIKNTGIKFTRFSLLKSTHFLTEETQDMLVMHMSKQGLDTYQLFNQLLELSQTKQILKRADMKLNTKTLKEHSINKQTMPYYPLPSVRSLLIYALEEAILTDSPNIQPMHLFLAYMKVFPVLRDLIQKEATTLDLLREVVWYFVEQERKLKSVNYFNINFPYYKTGGVARQWIYGYTFVLNKFSRDITQKIVHEQDRFGIGHDNEVEELASIIGRLSKSNALLIGEPGVGKSSLIKGLAQRINHGDVPQQLANKRIIQLDVNGLIALGSGKEQNIEKLITSAMEELQKAGNVILYIDEIQEIIPARAEESGHSLAGILLPYILDGKFPIVGSINYSDYKRYFYSNESLRQSFESVEVQELAPADALRILETKIPNLEKNYSLYVTFPALTASIELAQRYIADRKLPDSAVGTIEAAASWSQAAGVKVMTNEHVAKSVAIQTEIPVENISVEEATELLNLEQKIKERVIGQDEAVHAVVEALKRARTDIRDPEKPIGVFMFMGPTGTGKTHLSKILSEEYFKSKQDIVRLDMSEYQEVSSINKILGVSEGGGYGSTGITLLDKIKSNPHTVVLFDEIEKAHPQILDLFLQLFDEGRLTSNHGETVNFNNAIIICTSNIGSSILLESLEKDKNMWEEAKQRALLELRGSLKPELLNRFDKIVVFQPHDINALVAITNLLLNQLAKRIGDKGISLEWNDSIPMLIANSANEPGMGARPIKRFIQEKIESRLADELLSLRGTSGNTIEVRESWLG